VRDYGPIVGHDADGRQVAVSAVYDPLPTYPQARDDAMPGAWAAWRGLPFRKLDWRTEGGNIWSDGAGTLIMSEDIFDRNASMTRAQTEARLHQAFAFDKLIVTRRLWREETGHVDLLVKLARPNVVMITGSSGRIQGERLHQTIQQFMKETNAAGQTYEIFVLPVVPLYLNWGVYPVWRSYTNALTVNGRVLVPVFGIDQDGRALSSYQRAFPGYDIIPIDCRVAANGGGAVHCLTKEIPAARGAKITR
jgi:agmatine/peptidylarginine deiminase